MNLVMKSFTLEPHRFKPKGGLSPLQKTTTQQNGKMIRQNPGQALLNNPGKWSTKEGEQRNLSNLDLERALD